MARRYELCGYVVEMYPTWTRALTRIDPPLLTKNDPPVLT